MADLHRATERLQAALDRIERVVERDRPALAKGDLQAALRSARSKNEELQKVARKVADRLDGTIARLKSGLRT